MYDYAFVHVVYTIPLALVLTAILYPLFTRLDVYKICFLITIAFLYTLPWDAYLIHKGIWTYPPDSVLGPTLFGVPAEELFFFVIQTYITSCIYIFVNKSTLPAVYLRNEAINNTPELTKLKTRKILGQVFFNACFVLPLFSSNANREGTYLRLISSWASPVLLMLWTFAYQLLQGLPQTKTRLPILLPTLYLWIVDTFSLRKGTWSIQSGTKLGYEIWPHLEVEEAVFFLATNTLIVFGSCAFDTTIGILDVFPDRFPDVPSIPSPLLMMKALLTPTSEYDQERLQALHNALAVLAKKSRSFYLASGVFTGRLRIDLILLYAFCRVADDLIDNAADAEEAKRWIKNFSHFLDVAYSRNRTDQKWEDALAPFPSEAQSVLAYLPIDRLPPEPLYRLLEGFKLDVHFMDEKSAESPPVKTTADLEKYANCVAATIGELCLNLVFAHDPARPIPDSGTKQKCLAAGARMGRALQYVNIVRDVHTDAKVGRCYIPDEWFDRREAGTPEGLKSQLLLHREKILDMAFGLYAENRDAIEELPQYARDGIRVAVESYMEIGRVIRERIKNGQAIDTDGGGRVGRATVPKHRRYWVGWRTMAGWRGSIRG